MVSSQQQVAVDLGLLASNDSLGICPQHPWPSSFHRSFTFFISINLTLDVPMSKPTIVLENKFITPSLSNQQFGQNHILKAPNAKKGPNGIVDFRFTLLSRLIKSTPLNAPVPKASTKT
jgi:hypothetical protein